jgi:hypothetical protein
MQNNFGVTRAMIGPKTFRNVCIPLEFLSRKYVKNSHPIQKLKFLRARTSADMVHKKSYPTVIGFDNEYLSMGHRE